MDRAKQAVGDFLSKSGHHDTTVHEKVAPGVTNETINEQQREERQIATDREVHQDHYHTSVQPVKHREVLPEQHHHNLIPVEHRTHDHRDHDTTQHHLQTEAAQFKDQSVRAPAQHTSMAAPAVTGEHVHHHVHETIQPVVHKETVEPHVVHTTVPVHEVHHNEAKHHAGSALPAVSMADFKKQGGSLTGRDERIDHFAGEPKSIEKTLGSVMHHSGHGEHGMAGERGTGDGLTGTHGHGHHHEGTNSGLGSSGIGHRNDGANSGLGSTVLTGQGSNTGSGIGTSIP